MLIDRSSIVAAPLAGRVALVTGAGRGIGRETARVLARVGATVVVAEIDDAGQNTVELIRSAGGSAIFVRTDVGEPPSMDALRDQIRVAVGEVDILVNNAAAFVIRPIVEQTRTEWDQQLDVNLGGAFTALQLFVPPMVERRFGVIVFLGSAEGMPYLGAYSATKTALRSLSASLAAELGPESGVSAYLFNPGMVNTPGGRMAFETIAKINHLTLDAFIAMSAPGGSLTSAEVSATGLVGTIIHASDFHGLETDYVTGLARLGLAPDGQPLEPASEVRDTPPGAPNAQAASQNRAVEAVLEAMIAEINGASMFARPMLRRGFRQATGMSLEEFIVQARGVSGALESGTFDGASAERYLADLERLSALIEGQTGMLRGWERDPAKLQAGLAALADRRATVDGTRTLLADLVGAPV